MLCNNELTLPILCSTIYLVKEGIMNIEKWKSQILRGTLEYCVLLLLRQTPRYGYEILQELNAYPFISSTESTIYPLLRRLEKEGYLHSFWRDSAEGLPPRKYYSLTDEGQQYLNILSKEWNNLSNIISALKGESL